MRKMLMALMVLLLLIPASALAERMYILPESDTRKLTWEEIDYWDYETLGYAFNEIFARHGYNFEAGEDYDNYFRTRPWYVPNRDSRNQAACYPQLNSVEWYNVDLIKQVRAAKKQNDYGHSIWDSFSTGFDTLQGFNYVELRSGQKLAVYSAPTSKGWRGNDGNASVSTNGAIYAAGWEGSWLLIMYETNDGSVRVGYVNGDKVRGGVPLDTSLHFDRSPAVVASPCSLTDDPARSGTEIVYLRAGDQVTYLTRYYNNSAWDYVETTVDGKRARGFVPAGSLYVDHTADPLETVGFGK